MICFEKCTPAKSEKLGEVNGVRTRKVSINNFIKGTIKCMTRFNVRDNWWVEILQNMFVDATYIENICIHWFDESGHLQLMHICYCSLS